MVKKKEDRTDPTRKSAQKPALGQGSGRPKDKFKFQSTGSPKRTVEGGGGQNLSASEYKQKKREAEVEVATGRPFGETPEETRKKEITETAQRSFDIGEEKERLEIGKGEFAQKFAPPIIIEGTGITKEEKEQNFASKALDIIAAPLSQPSATLREGLSGGAAEVKESRERIEEGGTTEGGSVILTSVISTGVAVGALLTGIGGALALTGNLLGAASYAGVGLSTLYGIDKVFYNPGELANWAAVDNVVSALGFQSKEITKGVVANSISKEDAQESFEQMLNNVDDMRAYVRTQTARNPKMYASGKIFMEAINTGENGILQQYNLLKG